MSFHRRRSCSPWSATWRALVGYILHVLVAQMLQHVVAHVITHAVSQATFVKRTKSKKGLFREISGHYL
jgi:hypothetical protein